MNEIVHVAIGVVVLGAIVAVGLPPAFALGQVAAARLDGFGLVEAFWRYVDFWIDWEERHR